MHPVKNGRTKTSWSDRLTELGPVLTLGINIGVCIALGLAIGYAADEHWQTAPWGLCLGTILGMAAALRNAWLVLRRSTQSRG